MNRFGQPQPKPKPEKKRKCRIVTRKKPDGTITREMDGCTPQEAKALMELGKIEED